MCRTFLILCNDFVFKQEGGRSLITAIFLKEAQTVDQLVLYLLEWIGDLGKTYTTTMIIFFCINCVIIADKFRILAKQIKKMPQQSTTRHLLELQSDHLLLCQSVQLLNVTFGPVLLLEILFVSIGFTNTIMKILLKTNSFGLVLILRVIFIVSYSTNLILICNSAELIRTEVIISYC